MKGGASPKRGRSQASMKHKTAQINITAAGAVYREFFYIFRPNLAGYPPEKLETKKMRLEKPCIFPPEINYNLFSGPHPGTGAFLHFDVFLETLIFPPPMGS